VIFRREEPELKCPMCGYDLRGSLGEDDRFRCPECGAHTNAQAIIDEHAQRQHHQKQVLWFASFVMALLVFLTVAPTISFLHDEMNVLGIFAVAAIAFILWLSSLQWVSAPLNFRLLFAGGGGALVFLCVASGADRLATFLLLIWCIAFYIWAERCEYL